MIFLLFLLPITDSIIPPDPAIGQFNKKFRGGFLIENRYQIKELTGAYLALWGQGFRFSVDGYGLGPLKIYCLRASHATRLFKNLALGFGISGHIYQFDDGSGHAAYGVDGGLSYCDQLISVTAIGLDLNRPRLTSVDQVDPRFSFSLSLGQNPTIQLELVHEDCTCLYSGFSMPLSRVISVSLGFKNNPREFFFGFGLNLTPRLIYAGSVHETLGLSHKIGVRL